MKNNTIQYAQKQLILGSKNGLKLTKIVHIAQMNTDEIRISFREEKEMVERITKIYPAWDRRDPNPSKNYGIHGAELRMVLKGELGATQFVLYTNWHLPHVTEELLHGPYKDELDIKVRFLPLPADVGYHSPTPLYEGQTVCSDHCEYLDGKPCYYDGSGLFAEEVYKKLVEGGSDEVWKILEERYIELFGELK